MRQWNDCILLASEMYKISVKTKVRIAHSACRAETAGFRAAAVGGRHIALPPLEQHVGGRVHVAARHGQRASHGRVRKAHADQLLHGGGVGRDGVGAGLPVRREVSETVDERVNVDRQKDQNEWRDAML